MRGSALLRPSRVRGSALARRSAGGGWSLGGPLPEAALLLRAASVDSATYTTGDPWLNEGTTGPAINALTGADTADEVIAPVFTDGGFLCNEAGQAFLVADDPTINAGADDDFTLMFDVGVENIAELPQSIIYGGKRDGGTIGGTGWSFTDWNITSPMTIDGAGVTLTAGGSPTIVHTRTAWSTTGRKLGVFRLDRATDVGTWWVDGVLRLTVDCSAIGDLTSTNSLSFGTNGPSMVLYGMAYWRRALTDAEITGLAAALA